MTEESQKKRGEPKYYGARKILFQKEGFAIWVPSNWYKTPMKKGHTGVICSPYKDNLNTSFTAKKVILKYKVKPEDLPILKEGFEQGLQSLPGIEIESTKYEALTLFVTMEARFTFLEDGVRRKRWVRNIYWGEGQLIFIAQGETVEEFEYWEPMFFNTMMTFEFV